MSESSQQLLIHGCFAGDMEGGVQNYTRAIREDMIERGMDVVMSVGTATDVPFAYENMGAKTEEELRILGGKSRFITGNSSQNPLGSFVSGKTIERELATIEPDIIHINGPWMPHIGGKLLSRAGDALTVATYHIHSEDWKTNAAQWAVGKINRNQIQRLDHMIYVSEAAQEHAEQSYRYKGEASIIPNGVDIGFFENAQPFEADEPFDGYDPSVPTIGFVGRPDKRKGLGELLLASANLKRHGREFQLLVGGGKEKSLKPYIAMAEELEISDMVHFLGYVSEGVKARLYASSDVAAQPALYGESQGIVLLEAMASGAGVVLGGDNPGYRGVLGRLLGAEFVLENPTHTQAFSEKLMLLLDSPAIREQLHTQQQHLVRTIYDRRLTSQQVYDLYQRLLS